MQPNKIVSRSEWIEARKALLVKEKAMTRQRDRISAERRDLPWVKVEKDYHSTPATAGSRSPSCSTAAAS
jgi:predicted dithiol-disulfide oxidoreductase (DUF899 family)